MKVNFTCSNCGNKFLDYVSQRRNQKEIFCSRDCYYEWQSKAFSEDGNGGAKVCPTCGKTFWSKRQAKRVFCSNVCSANSENGKAKFRKYNATRDYSCTSPHARAVRSKRLKERWQDTDYKAKMVKLHKDLWQNPEYRERQAVIHIKTRKRVSEKIKNLWRDPAYRDNIVKKWFKAIKMKPNKAEQKLGAILDVAFPGQWAYVGDGKIFIAGKVPDFIYCNGRKLLIELFGVYWHKPEDEEILQHHYSKYGFKTLVIWDKELPNSEVIVNKVCEFLRC